MKESLILVVFVIIFYIIFALNGSSLVTFEKHGNTFMVRDSPDIEESAILLGELINRMYILRDTLVTTKSQYTDYSKYISLMEENFNRNRTRIYETNFNSQYTSYSVNKGEELVFCLRCKQSKRLHQINILMYVAVHEMAHTACPETGHTILFNKIFKFLLERSIDYKLYTYENYNSEPVSYCGMTLNTHILN